MNARAAAAPSRRPRRRRWLLVAGAILACLVAAPFAAAYAVYWHALKDLPGPLPQTEQRYPDGLRQLYWRLDGGQGPIRVQRLNPPGFAWKLFGDTGDGRAASVPADQRLLYRIASLHPSRLPPRAGMLRWHLAQAALAIRLSREYDGERLIDYALERSHFATEGVRGIDAAAQRYFGLPLRSLSAQEHVALLMLAHSPSYFDPACHPERFARRYAWALAKTGLPATQAMPARMRAGTCAQGGGAN